MPIAQRGILAAAATALMTALASPAAAQPGDVTIGVHFPDMLVAVDSEGATERIVVMPSAPVELDEFTVEVDFSALAAVATVTPEGSSYTCVDSPTAFTCTAPFPERFTDNTSILPEIKVKPGPGATAGSSGQLQVTISAKDFPGATTSATVTFGEGVDLAAGPRQELSAAFDASVTAKLEVRNAGPTTADGAVAVFYGDYGILATGSHSNCFYSDGHIRACEFDEQLAPATAYHLADGLPLAFRPDTAAPGIVWMEIEWMTPAEFTLLKQEIARNNPDWLGEPGDGSELDLVEAASVGARGLQADTDPSDNWAMVDITVTGDNPVDLAAIGGSAVGDVGTVITMELGLKNNGPATVDNNRSGDSPGAVRIELPLARRSLRCRTGAWPGNPAMSPTPIQATLPPG